MTLWKKKRNPDPDEPALTLTRKERRAARKRYIHLVKTCPFWSSGHRVGRRVWFYGPQYEDDGTPYETPGDEWWRHTTGSDEYGRATFLFPVWFRRRIVFALWDDYDCGFCEQDVLTMIEMMEDDLADPVRAQEEYDRLSEEGWL